MIQAKQKRGFIRRATITLAAIAAGSLPMVMPQWMTSLSAQTYGYGVFDLSTETLSFSEIVIPLLDALTGEQIKEENKDSNVFQASLNRQSGSGWVFELNPWSFVWDSESTTTDNPVAYDNQTGTIDIPCVKVTFILPSPQDSVDFWYKDGVLEQVDRDDPIFELVSLEEDVLNTCSSP